MTRNIIEKGMLKAFQLPRQGEAIELASTKKSRPHVTFEQFYTDRYSNLGVLQQRMRGRNSTSIADAAKIVVSVSYFAISGFKF